MIIRVVLCSCTDYHQSGNNTVLRVGAEPLASHKAGVFHDITTTEHTTSSHGPATEYCGRVVYGRSSPDYHILSSGFGLTTGINISTRPLSECACHVNTYDTAAHCYYTGCTHNCPLGWGNQHDYFAYLPGCNQGSYYPNPTQNSDTTAVTGSLYSDKCIEPVLINENLCRPHYSRYNR